MLLFTLRWFHAQTTNTNKMPCAGSSHFSVFIKPVLIVQAALRLKALIYDTSHNALPALCAENKMLGLVPAIRYLCSRLRI